ncbi:hypothetical protein EGI31_21810 [Lacihabitans soyangensis]|uniref:Uncharacterized protein n=2 Tax=Lacihabitans soyangensis TaxID=869394 RepID=A0AAE3H7K8_9BACT|nr:hypothetical protein [Lacihabitans soyangensis]
MFFWSLLNIGLFLYFIFVGFKVILLGIKHLSGFALVVFIFGLLSFMTSPKKHKKNIVSINQENRKVVTGSNLPQGSGLKRIELENGLLTQIHLNVLVSDKGNGQVELTDYSGLVGLVSGLNWQVQNVEYKTVNNHNMLKYTVHGILQWKLLGMTVYSQLKVYEGTFSLINFIFETTEINDPGLRFKKTELYLF